MSLSCQEPLNERRCIACGGDTRLIQDFGDQPLTNRFRQSRDEPIAGHPMQLGTCPTCGLVQLLSPVAPELLKPLEPLSYREPERHLDALADEIQRLPGLSKASRFCGVTYKDATTLSRLGKRGFEHLDQLDAQRDLEIVDLAAGLETIQQQLTPAKASQLARRWGLYDVVIVRHILEHSHRLAEFVAATTKLVKPGGFVVFEVPDCTNPMRLFDYTMMWEDHITYFTPASMKRTIEHCGLSVELLQVYPYPQESSLVAIARVPTQAIEKEPRCGVATEVDTELVTSFAASYPLVQRQWSQTLSALRSAYGSIALFGAGHRAATFVNLLGLADAVDFVVDETTAKVGRYLPGCGLRISSPSILAEQRVRLCMLAVSSEYEEAIVQRYHHILDQDGQFISIFPNSPRAIKHAAFNVI